MIGTKFLDGQGLGNQIFCYVTSRCIAIDNECDFACAGKECFANNIHSRKGMYFMDIYLGVDIQNLDDFSVYNEKEKRVFLDTCIHDLTYGCYVAGVDENLLKPVKDNTLIAGNMQSEEYFIHHKAEICEWLKVSSEYDDYTYSRDNLCILHMRGGDYVGNRALLLKRKYWENAIANMKKISSDMEFMIVTDDVNMANYILPNIKAYRSDIAKDYVTIKNAYYLILSNSSFAFFPAFTSETIKYIIAPKYWARHNVSDGYWASEQNIYSNFNYQDRAGNLFTATECKNELNRYKYKPNKKYSKFSKKMKLFFLKVLNKIYNFKYTLYIKMS